MALGEKEIDGHKALGYRCESLFGSATLWGDPATGLPLEMESVFSGEPRVAVTMSDFKLDMQLDEALFDTTPPEGYKVQSFDVDASPYKEEDVVKFLRLAAEWTDGAFPDQLNMAAIQKLIMGHAIEGGKDKLEERMGALMQSSNALGRGAAFVAQLPTSANAHYAGKGAKLDEPDRPVFWYKPAGEQKYHVIYADLSVQEQATPPEVPGAVRLESSAEKARSAADAK